MITVATYSFPYEAHIARARLEAEGIPAFVCDEHTINMQWLYSNALGGVRVQVPDDCAHNAREVLAGNYVAELVKEQGNDPVRCPGCGSEDVEQYVRGRRMAFLAFLFLGFPLWRYRYTIRCHACGAESKYET